LNRSRDHLPAFANPETDFYYNKQQQQQQQQQPVLTVQERQSYNCMVPPIYNGVNPSYPGLRMLNANPPVFAVDNFLTPFECDFLIHHASDSFAPAPVVGKGVGEVSTSRTSSTCYLAREDLPDYMRKISLLTGKPIEHCELPQVGRYLPSQQYLQVRIVYVCWSLFAGLYFSLD
jgi:hypothetical protein